ncbi:hypothetical protein EDF74_0706 [Stenotrophomonas rhizophila]|jgi:hypothetical protein|uniref:hypothetical protein n=1 Tax=Stenotrophomonas TaxID=40323 RepID=UPI000F4C12E4|nr:MULTISPECIES: hypothetical protein [Stenotrophomonas]MCW6029926.1 hypothetical protein [Stenotrophomonas sp. SRS1]ROP79654.1 hypothetical protein EDF74_0706 [Stenotrophomonas rhizophila]
MLALCALAGNAYAQRVYKCQEGTQTIYQTVPCPAHQDTGVTRPIVKDPNLTWEERTRAERDLYVARKRMQADAGRGQPPVRGTVISSAADPEKCDELRFRRDLAETLSGQSAPQRINDAVAQACAAR